jgi:pimeloyl-ACP methyl ester carboxylesterase
MSSPTVFKSEEGRAEIMAYYDAVLARWPVPYQTMHIPTTHGETFVIASGDPAAPPLVLLHGTGSNSAMWIGDVALYSREFRVYALDMPGDAGKSEAIRAPLNSPAYVEWLEEVLAALGIEQVIFKGISLGSWLALKFSVSHPERVKKLVLLCPSGVAPQKMSFMLLAIPLMFMGRWGINTLVKVVNGGQDVPEEALKYSSVISSQFVSRLETVPLFSDEELKRLTMPVLLYVGVKDVLLPSRKTAARLAQFLPRLTAHVLPDKGHVLINLTNEILPFIQEK